MKNSKEIEKQEKTVKREVIETFRANVLAAQQQQDLSLKEFADRITLLSHTVSSSELLRNIIFSRTGTSIQNAIIIAEALKTTVGHLLPVIKSDTIHNAQSYMLLYCLLKQNTSNCAIVSERISQEMKLHKFTFAKISEEAKISLSAVQAITTSLTSYSSSITTLWLIANTLGVEIDSLLPNANVSTIAEKVLGALDIR